MLYAITRRVGDGVAAEGTVALEVLPGGTAWMSWERALVRSTHSYCLSHGLRVMVMTSATGCYDAEHKSIARRKCPVKQYI